MENSSRLTIITVISILCGVWFLLTSWFWVYLFCVFFSYPVGLIGIALWWRGQKKDPQNKGLKASLYLHILGLTSSIITLAVLAIFN